ncbi:MAG: UTP--glucose-1-phosphate uridylyltransferase [Myxococcota bacterium]
MGELDGIDAETSALLQRYGFDAATFQGLRERLRRGEAGASGNRIRGSVSPPEPGDVLSLPPAGSPERERLAARGRALIAEGAVASVILAGGMATRFGGVVKAGVEAAAGQTFLELKLADAQAAAASAGGRVPVYLMASFATEAEVRRLGEAAASDTTPVETFAQAISLRLDAEGGLFRDGDGQLSPYAPGHGDLPWALRHSGVLQRFRAAGGRVLVMSNVDNVTATLDPAIVGLHLEGGKPMTAEMAPKLPGDKGGAPARVDGSLQIVEAFRFPEDFDQDQIPVFNTNTLLFDAEALDQDFALSWFAVRKKVKGAEALQFERLVGELSAFLPATYVRVERTGPDARFQPVKDPAELERRQEEILGALRSRGILTD